MSPSKLENLVGQIEAEFKSVADAGGDLSMSSYNASLRHVKSLAGQIFNHGRSFGYDEHASEVRQNLLNLANSIPLTRVYEET
jgi:hypothetical protein